MNKKLVTAAILAILTANSVMNVKADSASVKAINTTKADNMVIEYVEKVWNAKVKPQSCNMTADYVPELWMYLDGDTDPITAYSDYLGDFGWWLEQNNICLGAYQAE